MWQSNLAAGIQLPVRHNRGAPAFRTATSRTGRIALYSMRVGFIKIAKFLPAIVLPSLSRIRIYLVP